MCMQAKANEEASYWATIEEEHQQAMQRQLAVLQVCEPVQSLSLVAG